MIFLNKTDADFYLWCKEIVPDALVDRSAFRRKQLDPHEERERYDEVLAVYRQLTALRYKLDEQHVEFLNRYLLGTEVYERTAINSELYREIFAMWCEICFPDGLLREQCIDNIIMGSRLKALRIEKGIGVNRASELIGIDKKTLYAYEEGKCQVKFEVLLRFSQLYDFQIDELIREKGVMVTGKG